MLEANRVCNARFGVRARFALFLGLMLSLGESATVQAGPRFTVSLDGQEVVDGSTGLIWRRCAEGTNWNGISCSGTHLLFSAQDALQRAASVASSTGVAWRLPNVKELASLVDRHVFNPALDLEAFPATPSAAFWCSSPNASNVSYAWYVDFAYGEVYYNYRYNINAVRLVRGGLP